MSKNGTGLPKTDKDLIKYISLNKRRPTVTGPKNETLSILKINTDGSYILQDPANRLRTYHQPSKGNIII